MTITELYPGKEEAFTVTVTVEVTAGSREEAANAVLEVLGHDHGVEVLSASFGYQAFSASVNAGTPSVVRCHACGAAHGPAEPLDRRAYA